MTSRTKAEWVVIPARLANALWLFWAAASIRIAVLAWDAQSSLLRHGSALIHIAAVVWFTFAIATAPTLTTRKGS